MSTPRLPWAKRLFAAALIPSFLLTSLAAADPLTVPANTRVYIQTDEFISGKKGTTHPGDVIRASIWRDVVVDGQTVIAAGTPVIVKVDDFKKARFAGLKGKISLGAYETTLIDGTPISLGGGLYKEGKGRMALSITLAAVVFIPLIFIKGKAARLPEGTVFDAHFAETITFDAPGYTNTSWTGAAFDLSESKLKAEVLYGELETQQEPEIFAFAIEAPKGSKGTFVIDRVNGKRIKPVAIKTQSTGLVRNTELWRGEVKIKALSKQFKKGINTFQIATEIEGKRVAREIVLDIEI